MISMPWQVHNDLAKLRQQRFRAEADVIRTRHDARRAARETRRALREAARLRRVGAEPQHVTKPTAAKPHRTAVQAESLRLVDACRDTCGRTQR